MGPLRSFRRLLRAHAPSPTRLGLALILALAAGLSVVATARAQSGRAFSSGARPSGAGVFREVDAAVQRGIDGGVYPGAVVVIGRRDSVLYARGYGHLTWSARSPGPRPDSTIWDLASITKVVATTTAAMLLVDRGQIVLDAPVSRYLPRFRGERKSEVTVRMLLDHTSGMPSYREYFRRAKTRSAAADLLFAEPLQRVPGDTAVYSDLNAMLLGMLVESVAREPLDAFAAREIFRPLGMSQTMFNPPARLRPRIAPTGVFRGRPSAGTVFDRNALVFGGVAGHAGVFSTGLDLARFAQVWLREGAVAGRPLVRPATVRRFLTPTPRSGTRLLGWDTRDTTLVDRPSIFGSLVSSSVYGHTGWTGTMLWIDPGRDLYLVFLTNRSYAPRRSNSMEALREVRAELADAVMRALPASCQVLTAVAC